MTLALEPRVEWEERQVASEVSTAPSEPELKDCQRHEIAVAVADETCQREVEYRATYRAVRVELEDAFVSERATDIEYLTMARPE